MLSGVGIQSSEELESVMPRKLARRVWEGAVDVPEIDISKYPPCRHDDYNRLLNEVELRGFPDILIDNKIIGSTNLL